MSGELLLFLCNWISGSCADVDINIYSFKSTTFPFYDIIANVFSESACLIKITLFHVDTSLSQNLWQWTVNIWI